MKKEKGIELNSNIVAGALSVAFIVGEIISIFIAVSSGVIDTLRVSVGIGDILILVGFSYTAYKTLIKNEKLTKWEWVAWIILFLLASFGFLVGFMIGLSM